MSRIIVVTGSARGLGKATAEAIEKKGDRVIRVDLKEGDVTCDLSNKEGRDEMAAKVAEIAPGYIDGIVTYAGVGDPKPITLAINYFGLVASVVGVRPLLEKSPAPRVVTTSSRSSLYPYDKIAVELCLLGREKDVLEYIETVINTDTIENSCITYATSKVAVARWTRRNAVLPEWGGKGILMNCVCPGVCATPLNEYLLTDSPLRRWAYGTHPQIAPHQEHTIQPNEIGELSAWLASAENSILVGQCIFADLGTEAIQRGDQIW